MKLGFWNRLAIVLSGLALLIAPVVVFADISSEMGDLAAQSLDLCNDMARRDLEQTIDGAAYQAAMDECWQQFKDSGNYPGWTEYWQLVGVTAALCAVSYLLIWGFASLAKWVWRGRGAR